MAHQDTRYRARYIFTVHPRDTETLAAYPLHEEDFLRLSNWRHFRNKSLFRERRENTEERYRADDFSECSMISRGKGRGNSLSKRVRSRENVRRRASWRAREKKRMWRIIHLGVLSKASLLKHQQRACLYYCLHTYLCAEVEESEKGRRWRRKDEEDSLELVITESITRSYL